MKEILINLIGAEAFAILWVDERNGDLKREAIQGMGSSVPEKIRTERGPLQRAAAGEPFYADPLPDPLSVDVRNPIACVPLKIGTRVIGVIAIYRLLQQKERFQPLDFELFTLLGAWPGGASRPPALTSEAAHHWPALPIIGLGVLALLGWLVARDRLIPRRPISPQELLAGHTAAMLCLAVVALLVVATNPFALIFVLPSLHAWLWLPNVAPERRWARAGVVAAGFVGPALVVGSFAFRYGLGWDAPWYILELRALGYVPFAVLLVTVPWLAAAGQVAALAVGRYAPYPDVSQRPRLGPGRRVLRRIVLGLRHRRAAGREQHAAATGG